MQAPPPERGSPAWHALADQLRSARAEARALVARMVADGALLVRPCGPWASVMLASVGPGRRRAVCPHIAHTRGPRVLFAPCVSTLICAGCLANSDAKSPRQPVCECCGRPVGSIFPLRIVVVQHDQVIVRGRLCATCVHAEHLVTTH